MKPILFNTDMVRALQANRKTVTRRVVKPKYCDSVFEMFRGRLCEASPYRPPKDNGDGTTTRFVRNFVPCEPPYRPGDILYVRETWAQLTDLLGDRPGCIYRADIPQCDLDELKRKKFRWRPSIHMPREAARLFLRVTDVQVERLQDIFNDPPGPNNQIVREGCAYGYEFIALWQNTIKTADRALYGWDANPYVWVIEFERCEKPEAAS